jgi:hypothetical protein
MRLSSSVDPGVVGWFSNVTSPYPMEYEMALEVLRTPAQPRIFSMVCDQTKRFVRDNYYRTFL